jgi:hypothetical protein
VPRQGVVVEGVKEGRKLSCRPKYTKTAPKMASFPAFIDLKIAENAVFHSKVVNMIYSKDCF